MPDGIVFALGALVCAALNDIVFKKAVGAGISVGWFASMIGTTWGVVQVCGSCACTPAAALHRPRSHRQHCGLAALRPAQCATWSHGR